MVYSRNNQLQKTFLQKFSLEVANQGFAKLYQLLSAVASLNPPSVTHSDTLLNSSNVFSISHLNLPSSVEYCSPKPTQIHYPDAPLRTKVSFSRLYPSPLTRSPRVGKLPSLVNPILIRRGLEPSSRMPCYLIPMCLPSSGWFFIIKLMGPKPRQPKATSCISSVRAFQKPSDHWFLTVHFRSPYSMFPRNCWPQLYLWWPDGQARGVSTWMSLERYE